MMVIGCAAVLIIFVMFHSGDGTGINWNGNNWAMGCDFRGKDLRNERIPGEQCGGRCAQTRGCTHFAWSSYEGGTCWMKQGGAAKTDAFRVADNTMVCGVMENNSPTSTTWSVLKSFDLSSIDKVANDWQIIQWNPRNVNNELQAYIKHASTLFVRNGGLVLRAYRNNGKYYSARLHSNIRITPTSVPGRKLRVEYTAKVPTAMGAWPALWMLGIDGVYGGWPQQGEIDVMEWVWSIQNDIKSSLHWFSGADWSTDFQVTMQDISNTPLTYGVEYSAVPNNEYIQFYIKKADGSVSYGNRATPSTWHDQSKPWRPSPACSGYTPGASRCSPLAPFDNQMYLILNLAVGGDWGGVGVNNYNAFDAGVEMTVSADWMNRRVSIFLVKNRVKIDVDKTLINIDDSSDVSHNILFNGMQPYFTFQGQVAANAQATFRFEDGSTVSVPLSNCVRENRCHTWS